MLDFPLILAGSVVPGGLMSYTHVSWCHYTLFIGLTPYAVMTMMMYEIAHGQP